MKNAAVLAAIRAHAAEDHPRECCGFVLAKDRVLKVVRAKNVSLKPLEMWRINPEESEAVRALGNIRYVYHSHPNGRAMASPADMQACAAARIPFLIVAYPVDEFCVVKPVPDFCAPLHGRIFVHGVHDCYAYTRDHFKTECTPPIILPDFAREDEWWQKGQNLYRENIEAGGFVEIGRDFSRLRKHDMLLMKLGDNVRVENHSAIYLDSMAIGHHVINRLSRREFFSPYWQNFTTTILRHKSLL